MSMTLLPLTYPPLFGDPLAAGDAQLAGRVRNDAQRAPRAAHPRDLHLPSNDMGGLDEGTLAQYASALGISP